MPARTLPPFCPAVRVSLGVLRGMNKSPVEKAFRQNMWACALPVVFVRVWRLISVVFAFVLCFRGPHLNNTRQTVRKHPDMMAGSINYDELLKAEEEALIRNYQQLESLVLFVLLLRAWSLTQLASALRLGGAEM
jgi:hypothetical protein